MCIIVVIKLKLIIHIVHMILSAKNYFGRAHSPFASLQLLYSIHSMIDSHSHEWHESHSLGGEQNPRKCENTGPLPPVIYIYNKTPVFFIPK